MSTSDEAALTGARLMQPLILNLAGTGMVPERSRSPKVPLQPSEIVADVLGAAALGVTIVHLHARDENDVPTHRKEVYARIIGGIREHRPDLILCVSCSGRRTRSIEERAEVLELDGDLKPDMASLTVSSLNFSREASINPPEHVRDLAQRMLDRGIIPEVEIFDLGMVNILKSLQRQGLVPLPAYANLLFGNAAGAQADFLEIGALASRLPDGTLWSMAGLGSSQLPVAAMAAAHAPGVRIGLEDNLWLDRGRTRLASNFDLVERVHRMAELLDRPVMTPEHLRGLLGIERR
ncbi:MAG: 3-keto-5-aminohexanoate cleavage protein [Chthoniobacteraceae bacterium]